MGCSAVVRVGSSLDQETLFGSIDHSRDVTRAHEELSTQVDSAQALIGGLVKANEEINDRCVLVGGGDSGTCLRLVPWQSLTCHWASDSSTATRLSLMSLSTWRVVSCSAPVSPGCCSS